MVALLLERGADPNIPEEGIAPRGHALHSAVCNGDIEIVKLLLEYGAYPSVPIESSADTLSAAMANNDQPMIELLCSYGAARPVSLLAYMGDIQTAAAVFAANPSKANDAYALECAAGQGHDAFVRLMLRYQPDLATKIVEAGNNFKHDIIFISGAKTDRDAMRGEETQLIGCFPGAQEQVFIFPGTHSKHVVVKNKHVVNIKTYMTGEFFKLLSEKSILSTSVDKTADLNSEKNKKAFEAGVKESLHSNLLNSSFMVRTNYLFHKLTQQENYHYLSGLLIGTEIRELAGSDGVMTLVSDPHLHSKYHEAFNLVTNKTGTLQMQNADKAIVAGQLEILKRLLR